MIYDETIYLRHYYGFVINNIDPIDPKSGKIQCLVEELEWNTPDVAAWCNPRQLNSMDTPAIGETVEIYFMNADKESPVYLGMAAETGSKPASYIGPTMAVIYENPITGDKITYDLKTKSINIAVGTGGTVNLDGIASSEAFVKGTSTLIELNKDEVAMSELQSALNAWVPVPNDGGAALKALLTTFLALPMASYSGILSTKIKGN